MNRFFSSRASSSLSRSARGRCCRRGASGSCIHIHIITHCTCLEIIEVLLLTNLTSSVTKGTVRTLPLFLLIFRAWRVFPLSKKEKHTSSVCCSHFIQQISPMTITKHTTADVIFKDWMIRGALTSRRFWRSILCYQKNPQSGPWQCSPANQRPAATQRAGSN